MGEMKTTAEQRLQALGFTLPAITKPRGSFRAYVISGNTLHLSGKGAPLREDTLPVPKVGREVSVDEAKAFAQEVALHLLALTKEALGSLERVQRVVKVFGMVNAIPDFTAHTEVVNGCSDLLIAVLGERGEHARSAIGVGSLPKGFAVEIEAVIEFT
jgi:enamine deaminase RidA (YjgF/YER057c/UK114 family)